MIKTKLQLLVLLLITCCFYWSCEKEDLNIADNDLALYTEKMRGGKKNCTEYIFSYECTGPNFYTNPSVKSTTRCVNTFKGNNRIWGIQLETDWPCLVPDGATTNVNGSGLINCAGWVEMWIEVGNLGYHLYLSDSNGAPFSNNCAPLVENEVTCLTFNWIEIYSKGRHDKSCLIDGFGIADHTICVTNNGIPS